MKPKPISKAEVVRRLKAGEKLRCGYTYSHKALFLSNGDEVGHKTMLRMYRGGVVQIDVNGFVTLIHETKEQTK